MIELIKYILPLIGVIIGAFLHFIFSKRNESKKQQNLLKINAYTDLIKGLAISQKYSDIESEKEYKMLVADAKSRICVYGDDTVIQGIANFLRSGGSIDPNSNKEFVDIIVEIRKKHLGQINIDINDLSQLLIGTDINKNNS